MAKSKARYLADVLQGDGSLVFSGDLSVPTTFTIDPLPSGAGGSVTIGGDLVSTGGLGNASLENSSITINSYSTALGGTVTLVTDDVLEGGSPTNLYYTDTRVRAAISLTDTGGDGSLAYDSGTGAFTFAGPSAAETRAHFTAGTGVSITTGEIAIGQPVATTDAVTFSSVTGTGSSNFDTLTVSTSASIPYDNTISGLTATTVQSAISEINNLLGGGNIGSQASFDIHEFIATAAQVTFDLDTIGTSPHPSYIAGYIQVFLNGVLLSSNGDYLATDGQNIVLSSGADVGDILSVVILDSFDIANQLRVLSLDASAATNSLTIDSSNNVGIGGNLIVNGFEALTVSTVVTATSITATVNSHVYVSAATQTITLPASPTIGQRVLITVGNFTDTVVGRNGSNIMSSATDLTMDVAYLSIQFIYTDPTQGWVIA